MSSNTNPRVILITGASSGFGRLLTEIALANGDIVVGTLRKPEVLKDLQGRTPKERLLLLKVDVTKEDDIRDAFTKAKDKFGRVDVVYNNAAIWFTSTVEAVPDDKARALFETNFWGATRVSREAVRFFRDENPKGAGGRLIVISSAAGLIANGGIGFYSASKYALEAITEALAKEIDPQWNIKISLVEPGSFRTEGIGAVVHHPAPEAYSTPTSGYSKAIAMVSLLGKPEFKIGDARKGAQKLYELSTVENPPLRRLLGQDAVALTRGHLKGILEEVDASESWSSGLLEE